MRRTPTSYTVPSVFDHARVRIPLETVTLYCARITDPVTGATSASVEIARDFSADFHKLKYGGAAAREVELLWLWEIPTDRAEQTRQAILDAKMEALPPCAHMDMDDDTSRH